MRRVLLPLALVLAALALVASGCGDSSSGNALDDSLGYVPKNSLAVIAIKTDPDDAQFKNIGKLIDKFPFANQFKEQFKQGIQANGTQVKYEDDIKPLLGNDLVVAIPPAPGGLAGGTDSSDTPFLLAWETAGGDIEKLASEGDSRKVGEVEGFTVYQDPDGSAAAVKDDTVVAAKTRQLLDAALKGHGADDRMSEDDFDAGLGDLSKDALVRVTGNFQTILANDPSAAEALKVPWVKGLRTFGSTIASAEDGISSDFEVKTEGVTAEQQPLATGPAPAAVVRRPGEVGVGLRGPAQVVSFIESVAKVTDPESLLNKDKVGKQLGVDIDKDVVGALGENSTVSFSLDGNVAARADLKDPAAFKKTLDTIMKNLNKARRSQGKPESKVEKDSNGLYTVSEPGDDEPTVIGVVGEVLVIANEADRAQEIAGQSASPVPGTKGALVMTADPKSIVSEVLKKQGNSGAALIIGPALSSHLESLNGSVESAADGLRGTFKLTIK
ncbi:MAG TPA: DUF3352 domain-containing protein [Thermoleophilaceae bacterium]|nr:DUF3352 domain-containing protein [Thermoleophilaceae bacterium]